MATAAVCYATLQTGCNAAYVACCASLGFVAGTFTLGAGTPAALAACSATQGACMAEAAATCGIAEAFFLGSIFAGITSLFGAGLAVLGGLLLPAGIAKLFGII